MVIDWTMTGHKFPCRERVPLWACCCCHHYQYEGLENSALKKGVRRPRRSYYASEGWRLLLAVGCLSAAASPRVAGFSVVGPIPALFSTGISTRQSNQPRDLRNFDNPTRPSFAPVTPHYDPLRSRAATVVGTTDEDRYDEDNEGPILHPLGEDDGVAPVFHWSNPNDQRYSASDWLQIIKSWPRSTILRAIRGPILASVYFSLIVSALYQLLCTLGRTDLAAKMCIDSTPHSYLVSALGLLLVFRTNSAYQRFAEGRLIWERILSLSRNLSRMVILYENEFGRPRVQRVLRLLAAFPYTLHQHIQPNLSCRIPDDDAVHTSIDPNDLAVRRNVPVRLRPRPSATTTLAHQVWWRSRRGGGGKRSALFSNDRAGTSKDEHHNNRGQRRPEDTTPPFSSLCWVDRRTLPWCLFPSSVVEALADSTNRPLWICDRLSQEMNQVPYGHNFSSRERLTLLSHVGKLSKCVGECERITQTAVPLNYARHSMRSLTLWLFTLPFALVQHFGWLTAVVMGCAAWLLYGIYQIGYSIEDPFQGSLRLSLLCDVIFHDIMHGTDSFVRRSTAFVVSREELDEWDQMEAETSPHQQVASDSL